MLSELTWSFEPDDECSMMSGKTYDFYNFRAPPASNRVLSSQSLHGETIDQIYETNRQLLVNYHKTTREQFNNFSTRTSITRSIQGSHLSNTRPPIPTPMCENRQPIVSSNPSRVSQIKLEIANLEQQSFDLEQNFLKSQQQLQDEADALELKLIQRREQLIQKQQLLNKQRLARELKPKQIIPEIHVTQMAVIVEEVLTDPQESDDFDHTVNVENWLQVSELSNPQRSQEVTSIKTSNLVPIETENNEVQRKDQTLIAGEKDIAQLSTVNQNVDPPSIPEISLRLRDESPNKLLAIQSTGISKYKNGFLSIRTHHKQHFWKARRMLIKNQTERNHRSRWKRCYRRRKKNRKLSLSFDNWARLDVQFWYANLK